MESTNQTQTVTMSLGDNIGVLLHQMSVENVFAYNPKKAVSLWVDSFHCSEEIARGLVFGKYICDKNPENEGSVVVCKREDMDKERLSEYRLFDPSLFLRKVVDEFRFETEGALEFDDLEEEYDDAWCKAHNAVQYDRHCSIRVPLSNDYEGLVTNFNVDAMSSVRQVVNFCLKHNRDYSEFEIDFPTERKRVAYALLYIRKCNELLPKKDAMLKTLNFVQANCPMDKDISVMYSKLIWRLENNIFSNMEKDLATLQTYLNAAMPMSSETERPLLVSKAEDNDALGAYLKNQREIDKALDDFKPCDTRDKYDAGFIAPDGTFYGLNGTTANFLHIQLADAIMDRCNIKMPDDYERGKDFYLLGVLGYVKTCGDRVMHEGYFCLDGKKPTPLTPAQKKAICVYGETHYGGKLLFGLDNTPCSIEKFRDIEDDVHLAELFGFNL